MVLASRLGQATLDLQALPCVLVQGPRLQTLGKEGDSFRIL